MKSLTKQPRYYKGVVAVAMNSSPPDTPKDMKDNCQHTLSIFRNLP